MAWPCERDCNRVPPRHGVHASRREDNRVTRLFQPRGGPESRGAVGVAMSEANVEIAKGVIDAFNRRDYEKALHDFHADTVWHNTAEFPGQRICVGPEAIIDFWET